MKLLALFTHSSSPLLLALSLSQICWLCSWHHWTNFSQWLCTLCCNTSHCFTRPRPQSTTTLQPSLCLTAVWCNRYLTPFLPLLVDFPLQATPVGGIASVFPKSLVSFVLGGLMSNIVTFVLFWTLMYALVHLY